MAKRVFYIKLVHSFLFFVLTFGIGYVLYSGITQTYNWFLTLAIVLITLEGFVLFLNEWRYPLTDMAMKYGATQEQARVTSVFCPNFFVPYVFKVYGVLFGIGLIIVLLRYFL
jgi:hypothetical protein